MRLRAQLIVVSLFALLLPWAGCSFIYEMESVLRSGQQDALASQAGSIALLVEQRAAAGGLMPTDEPATRPVFFHTRDALPIVDGYVDEFAPEFADPATYAAGAAAASLSAEFVGMVGDEGAYAFIRVTDPDIRYHNPADDELASGDHVVIAMGDDERVRRYWLAPEAPGEFLARTRADGGVSTEARVRGVWRDRADGYQVELRIPASLLGNRFGFAVVDTNGDAVGSMLPRGRPGRVVREVPELTSMLSAYTRDDLRLRIVDSGGWRIAGSGELRYTDVADDGRLPGSWMIEALYRVATSADREVATIGGDSLARIERPEVATALAGSEASAWYGVEGRRGVAVASVALPLKLDDRVVGALIAEQSSSRILSLTNAAVMRLLLVTMVATVIISAGLVAYASFLSMRIRRLGRRVDAALTDDGQIAAGFPANWGPDEIGDLGRNFADLLGRMREYNEYLKSLASKLSHELRTPLAVVSSSLDNLEHESLSASARRYTGRARDGADRLARILTAMSEASRVEQSIRAAVREKIDLCALLERNVENYRQAFERDIECSTPGGPVCVDGSPDLLAQMLDKLMDNAAEFCPAPGRIAFVLMAAGPVIRIAVENDGPPLPEQMRGELFESMVSIRPERQERPHLGLGLTIVRLVAEYHGGGASAENRPEGGVRFVVELPVARAESPQ